MPRPLRPQTSGAIAALVVLTACSTAPAGVDIHDPNEARNRSIHDFNRGVDSLFVRDAGEISEGIDPAYTQLVVNFGDNVGLPGAVINGILQADIPSAGTNAFRFLLNSTVGVAGLFDPAGVLGLDEVETDFGETLYVWGVPEGAYVELPLYGPSTERDAMGRVVDLLIDPLDSIGLPVQRDYGTIARIGGQVIERGDIGDTVDSILYESADSYAQARLIYLQNRRFELGQTDQADTDTFVDPFEDFQ